MAVSDRVIDLTESEVLEANLRALGVDPSVVPVSTFDRVLTGYRELMEKHGRLVTIREVSDHTGVNCRTVQARCADMVLDGRMLTVPKSGGKLSYYVPRVV